MKKLLYVIVTLIFLLLGIGFYMKNPQMATINFYFDFQKQLPLAVLLLITLMIGILVGYFASLLKSLKLRRRLSKANKAVKILESEGAAG